MQVSAIVFSLLALSAASNSSHPKTVAEFLEQSKGYNSATEAFNAISVIMDDFLPYYLENYTDPEANAYFDHLQKAMQEASSQMNASFNK